MKTTNQIKEEIKELESEQYQEGHTDEGLKILYKDMNILKAKLQTRQETLKEVCEKIDNLIDITTILGIKYEDKKVVLEQLKRRIMEDGK